LWTSISAAGIKLEETERKATDRAEESAMKNKVQEHRK